MTPPKDDTNPIRRKRNYLFFWKLVAILLVLALVAVLADSVGHYVLALESWIAAQGAWGPIFFLAVFILLSSILVPDTVFAIIAGALFGLLWGTVLMFTGGLIASLLNFYIAQRFLGSQVRTFLRNHPKLSVVEHAAEREGIRLLFLLRLTPINPAIVSYILGSIRVPLPSFLIATLGLIPGFFVEVYFGYLINHMSSVATGTTKSDSPLHTAFVVTGFILCLATLAYLTHIARRALAESSAQTPTVV